MLEIPKSIWISLATDFIVHLPKTNNGYDSMTTGIVFNRTVHFVKSKTNDTSIEVSGLCFVAKLFKHHGIPGSVESDLYSRFTSEFWTFLRNYVAYRGKCHPAVIHKLVVHALLLIT